MSSERVHPNVMLIFWISDGDVPRHTLGEATSCKVPKCRCCVDEDVSAMFCVAVELGYARHHYRAMAYGF